MKTIESINLIYRDPKIRSGRPCIVGTDLRVLDIVISYIFADRSPDQLAEDYELSMAEVYAALAYYHSKKSEIDEDIREDFKRSDELTREDVVAIERTVYEVQHLARDPDAIRRAAKAQAAAAAQAVLAETIAEQVLEPLEQEVE